jgi:Arc/MetJ-type ribon-helix-helix transcriptional regulator
MNVVIRNKMLQILNIMVKEGYANTKSEAIRLAILNFGEKYIGEDVLVSEKLDEIDSTIKAGKRKTLNAKEALGIHAKYLK